MSGSDMFMSGANISMSGANTSMSGANTSMSGANTSMSTTKPIGYEANTSVNGALQAIFVDMEVVAPFHQSRHVPISPIGDIGSLQTVTIPVGQSLRTATIARAAGRGLPLPTLHCPAESARSSGLRSDNY